MTTNTRRLLAPGTAAPALRAGGPASCTADPDQGDGTPLQRALTAALSTSGLKKRDVTVNGRRTTMKLDDATWTALALVARLEDVTIDSLVAQVDRRVVPGVSLTAAVRVFVVEYLTPNDAVDAPLL